MTATAWTTSHPIGTRVSWWGRSRLMGTPRVMRGRVMSAAWMFCGELVVRVEGRRNPVAVEVLSDES